MKNMPSKEKDCKDEIFLLRQQLKQTKQELESLKLEYVTYQRAMKRANIPLFIASISRVLNDGFVILHTPNGNDYLVNNPFPGKLKPGDTVATDQNTLKILSILPPNVDRFIAGMELIDKPKETYSDIGGLDEVINEIREVVELPLKNPQIFEKMGIDPPSGVLLEGPPGCGKTLLARAVANATNASFIRLVGSELVQKFIGEGARLVRELFALARDKAPVIVFIDEIDAIASKRTPDSQVSDREVQRTLMQLLAEMDGFNPLDNVKIIGATNRPDILDPAILRPGRFDRIIHIDYPDKKGIIEIFKIHTRKMPLKNVDLEKIAMHWESEQLTGASIKAICTEAAMNAIREATKVGPRYGKIEVLEEDFYVGYQRYKRRERDTAGAPPVYV
ncbi:MAG: AAA family ATPase [Promethearchaeota archaeon]